MIFDQFDEFMISLIPNQRLLGLDVGISAIGVALSDTSLFIASPLDVVSRENINKDTGKLRTLVKEYTIAGIVIGLPKLMSGEEGETCNMVRQFATKLTKKIDIPIYLQDERMSTQAVDRALREHATLTRKKRNAVDDKMAAAYILQSTLDRMKQA